MSKRILLADDSVTIQKVIELTFMDGDFEVKAVSNGDEALALLAATKVDFIIADVHMPGANGYEVCRQAKQLRPNVPVLLLVGTFEPFDEAQAKAVGADSFLKKPFDSQELLQRVHDLLAARVATGAVPVAPIMTTPLPTGFDLPSTPTPLTTPTAPQAAAAPPQASAPLPDWHHEPQFELEPEPVVTPFVRPAAPPAPAAPDPHPFSLGGGQEPFRLDDERPFSLGGLDDSLDRPPAGTAAAPPPPAVHPAAAEPPPFSLEPLQSPLDDKSEFTIEDDHSFELQNPRWEPPPSPHAAHAAERPFSLGDELEATDVSLTPPRLEPPPTEPFRVRSLSEPLLPQAEHDAEPFDLRASEPPRAAGFGEWGPVGADVRDEPVETAHPAGAPHEAAEVSAHTEAEPAAHESPVWAPPAPAPLSVGAVSPVVLETPAGSAPP
ncbi:MAG TPA: response regulator, partial [Thermoanaerobaculia bacterium]